MAIINIEVQKAIADVRTLTKELNNMRGAIQGIVGVSSKAFSQLESRVSLLEKKLAKTNTTMKALTTTVRKQDAAMKKLNTTSKAYNKTSKSTLGGLSQMAGALGFAGVALAIVGLIKNIITLTVKFQSLGYAIKQTSNDLWEAGRSTQFLLELNTKFGADLVSTTERWLKFRTAARQSGLTLLATKKIFESVTKASAVLGLRTDELRGVYLALEQMLSKGKVTTEELRRQLGERLPGAMGIMAAALGKTIPELDKMLKKGEVLSADVLPKFAVALESAYGIESLESVENLATSIGKMQGAWQSFVLYVVNSKSVFSGVLQTIMTEVTNTIKVWTRILGSEQTVFNLDLIEKETAFKKRLKATADLLTKAGAKIKIIDEKILQEKIDLIGKTEEEQKAANKRIELLFQEKIDLTSKSNDKQKKIAASLFDGAKEKYEEDLKDYEDAISARDKFAEESKNKLIANHTEVNEKVEEAKRILLASAAAYNIYRELIESPIEQGGIDTTSEGGLKRRIKFAQEFEKTNKLKILRLKAEIKLNKELADAEHSGAVVRDRILKETLGDMTEIAMLEREDRDTAISTAQEKEVLKWESTLSAFTVGSAKYIKQKGQFDIAIQAAQDKADEKLLLSAEKLANDLSEIERFNRSENIVNIKKNSALEKIELEKLRDAELKAQQDVIDGMAKGSSAEKRELEKLEDIRVRYFNLELQRRIALLRLLLKTPGITKAQIKAYKEQISSLEALTETFKTLEDQMYTGEGAWENWARKAEEVLDGIGDLGNAIFERRISNIDKEIEAETEKYERLLELAKGDEAETKIIERNKALRIKQLEDKKRREQIKQAKFEKAIALNKAIINTAVAVSAALTAGPGVGLALAVITAALAAIEVATIAATPIPSFAQGGIMDKDGKALINDGGNMEYVERNGAILTSSRENAIVDLQKGDVIHKDYDAMIRKAMLMNGIYGGGEINSSDDYAWMENAIEKGFKKARINNQVTVLNKIDDYGHKMTNW